MNDDEGINMTTATGPENVSPIEDENTYPDKHEGTPLVNRVMVADGEPCPPRPHVHADGMEGGDVPNATFNFGDFIAGLVRSADQEQQLKTMTAEDALSKAILNFRQAQLTLSAAYDIDPTRDEGGSTVARIAIKHADVLVQGYQEQSKIALMLFETLDARGE